MKGKNSVMESQRSFNSALALTLFLSPQISWIALSLSLCFQGICGPLRVSNDGLFFLLKVRRQAYISRCLFNWQCKCIQTNCVNFGIYIWLVGYYLQTNKDNICNWASRLCCKERDHCEKSCGRKMAMAQLKWDIITRNNQCCKSFGYCLSSIIGVCKQADKTMCRLESHRLCAFTCLFARWNVLKWLIGNLDLSLLKLLCQRFKLISSVYPAGAPSLPSSCRKCDKPVWLLCRSCVIFNTVSVLLKQKCE